MLVTYGNPNLRDNARLAALGVRIVVNGHAAYFAAIKATYDCLREQRQVDARTSTPRSCRSSIPPRTSTSSGPRSTCRSGVSRCAGALARLKSAARAPCTGRLCFVARAQKNERSALNIMNPSQ